AAAKFLFSRATPDSESAAFLFFFDRWLSTANDLRQEHPGLLRMRFKLFAEFLREKGFFAARLYVKGQPRNGHREQSAHFAHGNRRPKQTEQNPRINR